MSTLTISQLARRSGVPATTLRYYEKVGVLPAPARSDSGYRQYDDDSLARVAFIQRAKALGVELEDMGDLVSLWDGCRLCPRFRNDCAKWSTASALRHAKGWTS